MELLPASSLSVILGLHDRRKAVEAQRWNVTFVQHFYLIILPRKLVRVNKIIVHQNFSTHSHDIALLKLGKFPLIIFMWIKSIAEERVDLSKFPPVCLPQAGEVFPLNTTAFVYGGCALQVRII